MALTEEQIKYILELYTESNKNSGEAARIFETKYFPITRNTISIYWKSAGLELGKRGGKRISHDPDKRGAYTDKELEEILECYTLFGGNASLAEEFYETANQRTVPKNTFLANWKKNKLYVPPQKTEEENPSIYSNLSK